MAKTPKSRRFFSPTRIILLGLLVVLVVVLGVLLFLHVTSKNSNTNGNQLTQADRNNKSAVIDNGGVPTSPSGNNGGSDKNKSSAPYSPPSNPSAISITPSTSGNQVIIETKLTGYSDGTCALNITNGSQHLSQNAQVIYAPTFSSCAGFSIPISQLGNGTWNITLTVTSGGIATSKSVTYGVNT